MTFTVAQEIASHGMARPHVVLLGAGASRAALPDGDANGNSLPVMDDLVELLDLGGLLDDVGIPFANRTFEDLYADIYGREDLGAIRAELERRVCDFFQSLQLPHRPTIYDYLVLCLRSKDVIATFNWDPLLIQAYRRNAGMLALPRVLFLHGNVLVGCCARDKVMGLKGNACSKCGQPLKPTRLLYPVSQKNYEDDPMLSAQWSELRGHMSQAFMFTVFGYSAPTSDVGAVELLKNAWQSAGPRVMEETEIIDIKPENELTEVWSDFIHSHHYSVSPSFFHSWLARHPRRTGEAYIAQFIDAQFVEGNPVPTDAILPELHEWFLELHNAETHGHPPQL